MRNLIRQFITVSSICCLLTASFASPLLGATNKETVNKAWQRIALAGNLKGIPIHIENEKAPNAWVKFSSNEDFSVHVTTGLMNILQAEDEIAGVLAHEIGHIKRGHYARGLRRNAGWKVLNSLLGKSNNIVQAAGSIGINLAESGFSRKQEVEADDYGVRLSMRAGYSPWGLYRAMLRFKENGFATGKSGFNSHPPTERRLLHLKKQAQQLEKEQGRDLRYQKR